MGNKLICCLNPQLEVIAFNIPILASGCAEIAFYPQR